MAKVVRVVDMIVALPGLAAPGGGNDGHARGLHHGGDGVEEQAVAQAGLPQQGGRLPGEGRPQGDLAQGAAWSGRTDN